MSARVSRGMSISMEENISVKTGMVNPMMKAITATASTHRKMGYIMAERTLALTL